MKSGLFLHGRKHNVDSKSSSSPSVSSGTTRRDFIILTASTLGGVGAASAVWPFVHSMNPAADVLALATIEVDLSPIKEGQVIKVEWRGVPVFIRHRTKA